MVKLFTSGKDSKEQLNLGISCYALKRMLVIPIADFQKIFIVLKEIQL